MKHRSKNKKNANLTKILMELYIRTYFDQEIKNFWQQQDKIQNLNLFQSYIWNSKFWNIFIMIKKNKFKYSSLKKIIK